MFEIIAGWLGNSWDAIKPCEIIYEYDGGVHMRFGKYLRDLEPGVQWKIPIVDNFLTTNKLPTTVGVSCQSLETADGEQIVVEAVIRYRIADPRKYLLGCNEPDTVLNDTAIGAIGTCIVESNWEDFKDRSLDEDIFKEIHRKMCRFGIKVEELTFPTRAPITSFRLIFDQPDSGD